MDSITKTHLSRNDIKRLVEHSFGSGSSVGKIEEMTDGNFNSAYSIELLSHGEEVVLKLATSNRKALLTYEQNAMQTEVEVYRLLADKTEIPIPRLLICDFTKQVINNDYIFISKLKGIPWIKLKPHMTKEQNDNVFRELGGYCAQIHQIHGDYFGLFTSSKNLQYTSWKESFLSMVKAILKDGQEWNISLPCTYDEVLDVFEKKSEVLGDVKFPVLVNFDLWEGNVFILPRGDIYGIEGIIDFERAFWGDPCADFIPAAAFLNDIRKQEAFMEGYSNKTGKIVQIDGNMSCRLNMYRAYLCLLLIVEAYRYDEDYMLAKQKAFSGQLMKFLKKINSYVVLADVPFSCI